jgi:hypothetical protein
LPLPQRDANANMAAGSPYLPSDAMKLYGADNREMMQVSSIERDGSNLLIKGKIFGTMPLTAKLRPEELRAVFRLLDLKTIFFILTLVFRRKQS